jgi:hypothetical protein
MVRAAATHYLRSIADDEGRRWLIAIAAPIRQGWNARMQLALWIASGFLAFAMSAAGGVKLVTPRVKLMERMKWAKTWSDGNVKLLGLAEVLGGIGLVIPQVTGILPILTPIAAVCLVVLMIGAVKTHLDLKEPAVAPGILALLGVFVALGRLGVV